MFQTNIPETPGSVKVINENPARQKSCNWRYPVLVNEVGQTENNCITEHKQKFFGN